jgi:hypothetical protein
MSRIWSFSKIAILSLALSFLAVGQVLAQEEEEEEEERPIERPTLQVGALTSDFRFDGILSESAWADADSIENLVTIEPEEGGDPDGRTIVKVLANATEIVVGVYCEDRNPAGLVSYSKARDSKLDEEDHVMLVFDTFMDGRSGYVFAVNPSGARFDGLVIEQGEDVNSDWDAIWEAKTTRNNGGWYAEIRIPIKSLAFEKDLTTWGFNVQRRVQRLQETSRWSSPNLDYELFQTSRSGILEELPAFDFGVGMSIRPSVVGVVGRPQCATCLPGETQPGVGNEYDGDISLDITQRLGPNLLSALTVNTDFAETEVDIRQVNLTRFPLFFPEKRTFFLQGSDIFEFGRGLDEETLIPFFSRRIGLIGVGEDDLSEIPINAGGKINGRVGNTNIGALAVNTRRVDDLNLGDADEDIRIDVPTTTMGAVRVSQNILEESSVGMIATFGDQMGRSGSWSAGADFTYATSSFLGDKNFVVGAWGLYNDREDLTGDRAAVGFRIDYPNDLLDVNLTSIRIGDNFEPSLGFVPRNDVHIWNFTAEINPRPPVPWLRQMFNELSFSLYNNRGNSRWESYEATIKPFDWLLESGEQFEFSIVPGGDRPPELFEVASGVDIPVGSYQWVRYAAGARTAEKRKVVAAILWEFGDFYNGDLTTIEGRVALKPSAFFTMEFSAERNTGTVRALPEDVEEVDPADLIPTKFKEELYGVRLLLNISPDLQISSLTQYDNESRELGSNNKLRWTFNPFGEIFVVYNHNLVRNDENRWRLISNQLPVKIQYAWRF